MHAADIVFKNGSGMLMLPCGAFTCAPDVVRAKYYNKEHGITDYENEWAFSQIDMASLGQYLSNHPSTSCTCGAIDEWRFNG